MAKSAVITGASSGIGRSLAFAFAKNGYSLGLLARRYDLLKSLKQEILSQTGDSVRIELRVLDITMYRDVFKILKELSFSLNGIDILIANAGVAGAMPAGTGNFQKDKNIIETNLIGAIATVDAGLEMFRSQKNVGQIVGISSVAGARGFMKNASYSASKAGFTAYLEAVRLEAERDGIHISTILPGFIDTNMNSHLPERPFLISSEKCAELIYSLIQKKVRVSTVPSFPWGIIYYALQTMPDFIFNYISRKYL